MSYTVIAVFYVPFYKYLFYMSVIYSDCLYMMLVNVNVIYYVHVCEQAR